MNKQKALETIDAIQTALVGLEKALKHNDRRIVNIELQTVWVELSNLREMVENLKDKDS